MLYLFFELRGSNEEEKHFNQSKMLVSSFLANLSIWKTVICMDTTDVQAWMANEKHILSYGSSW